MAVARLSGTRWPSPETVPVAFGGSVEDSFDIVIPSLPGFGLSGKPTETGWNVIRIANAWTALVRIQGTHLGAFPTPVGEIRPTGNRIDVPTADLWYFREGKIETFNCYNAANLLLAQIGADPDFKSAIEAAKTATAGE